MTSQAVPRPSAGEPIVAWLDVADHGAVDLLGGKCASLAEMVQSGYGVPPAFAVTTRAFWSFLEGSGLLERTRALRAGLDRDDVHAVQAASAEMSAAFEAAPLAPALADPIRAAYGELAERTGAADVPVAVRSSGVAEDLDGASFAGQYDTFLWVTGADEVLRHVKRCWAGMFGAPVLAYRPADAAQGRDLDGPGIAVGVQEMVLPRTAGVMLTLDPLTGDRSKVVLEASWGLGESVVSGEVTPDRFKIDKVTLDVVERHVADKQVEHRLDPATAVVGPHPVPEERRARPSLEDAEIEALVHLAKRIERHRGAPQDIEWAIDQQGRVHVLQVRPETVWSRRTREPVAVAAATATPVDLVLAQLLGTLPAAAKARRESGIA